MLTWDLTIFGNTIGNKDRGEVIARTWFHSFFSRKKSEIWIAFTFFEKWKVKNKIPSLFFEKWKWNWNGSRSRTRSENEKKFSRILEKRESRWSLNRKNFSPAEGGQNLDALQRTEPALVAVRWPGKKGRSKRTNSAITSTVEEGTAIGAEGCLLQKEHHWRENAGVIANH